MSDNVAMALAADWCYANDRTYINGARLFTGTVGAKQINVTDLFAQNIEAKNMHLSGNSSVDGAITAKSLTLGDGKQCKLLWGESVPTYAWGGMASLGYYGGAGGAIHSLDIDAGGIALGSGTLGSDGSTIVENSEALMGVQGTGTGFVTAPNGFYVNGKLFDDYFPKQADSGYLHKDGYVCHLHCWGVAASSVVDTIPEKFRPKSQAVTVTGWCRNTNGQMYYPCVAMINTSGQWQVYAMTAFGGKSYVIYEPGKTDERYSFELLLSGSWVTAYNGA